METSQSWRPVRLAQRGLKGKHLVKKQGWTNDGKPGGPWPGPACCHQNESAAIPGFKQSSRVIRSHIERTMAALRRSKVGGRRWAGPQRGGSGDLE